MLFHPAQGLIMKKKMDVSLLVAPWRTVSPDWSCCLGENSTARSNQLSTTNASFPNSRSSLRDGYKPFRWPKLGQGRELRHEIAVLLPGLLTVFLPSRLPLTTSQLAALGSSARAVKWSLAALRTFICPFCWWSGLCLSRAARLGR